jgi:AcrR family transcriptional regulator
MAARKSPELRREEILDAAIRVIARKGFTAVTVRDVAAEAGVVHGLLRHYFAGRDELMAAAFERAVCDEMDAPLEIDDPVRDLVEWVSSTDREHFLVWIDAWSEAPRNPALRASLDRHHRDCEVRLGAIIEAGNAIGAFAAPDPAAAAKTITALGDGIAVQVHSLGLMDERTGLTALLGAAERSLGMGSGQLQSYAPGARSAALAQ